MAFDTERYAELILPHLVVDQENARENIKTVRGLSLEADTVIDMYYPVPSAEVSAALLEQASKVNEAIAWLATKLALNERGCWVLPLVAEYDSKNRARYPQVSNNQLDVHSELAHRFVIRRLFGVTLVRADHWDHLDRNHACCNPTHGELVLAKTNNARKEISARHIDGMEPLF